MTTRKRVSFENGAGLKLAAALELPVKPILYYAIFAHCFSCGKDIIAASRISRALANIGIAVLRFDFTGIGKSEGDFGNTNFTSNIADILSASNYLADHFQAPQLLIGHSLGGTAVLHAAQQIAECKAVVTIGAPSTPNHILEHFPAKVQQLDSDESVTVNIGDASFDINRQFVKDVEAQSTTDKLGKLRKALLIFHAPLDAIVSINEASEIFFAAKHPKSFISLDKADHLLTNADDAEYVANTIASWAARYIEVEEEIPHVEKGVVLIGEGNTKFLREVNTDDHSWLADEPIAVGGNNLGPDPYEQLLSALGTCTSMTMRMYANHKGWKVDDIKIELHHSRNHKDDCADSQDKNCKIESIDMRITLEGELNDQQLDRMYEIAGRCPVHKTLLGDLRVNIIR